MWGTRRPRNISNQQNSIFDSLTWCCLEINSIKHNLKHIISKMSKSFKQFPARRCSATPNHSTWVWACLDHMVAGGGPNFFSLTPKNFEFVYSLKMFLEELRPHAQIFPTWKRPRDPTRCHTRTPRPAGTRSSPPATEGRKASPSNWLSVEAGGEDDEGLQLVGFGMFVLEVF